MRSEEVLMKEQTNQLYQELTESHYGSSHDKAQVECSNCTFLAKQGKAGQASPTDKSQFNTSQYLFYPDEDFNNNNFKTITF